MKDKQNRLSLKKISCISGIALLCALIFLGLRMKYSGNINSSSEKVSDYIPASSHLRETEENAVSVRKEQEKKLIQKGIEIRVDAEKNDRSVLAHKVKENMLIANDSQKIINGKNTIASEKPAKKIDNTDPKKINAVTLPHKLLLPLPQVRLSKRNISSLCKDDLKTLDYINRKRLAANLEKLPILPTGLNDEECLVLLNGQLIEQGKTPLAAMPTGAIFEKQD